MKCKNQIIEVHLITTRTPDHLYIHELTVTAQQLASVAQLVRALHRNRRAVGSIPTRGPCAAFFSVVPGQILKCIYILTWITNPNNSIHILIPPSEVQESDYSSTNYDFFRKYFQAIIKDTKDHPSIRFPNSKSMNFSTLLKLVWKTQTLPSQDKVNCHVTLKQFY